MAVLKAALNLAADRDDRITNRDIWYRELANLPDVSEPRNVVVSDSIVQRIVAAAYAVDERVGLLFETAAVTGARFSQLARLRVSDLDDREVAPRLLVPTARGQKKHRNRPVPIAESLAKRLRTLSEHRDESSALLLKPDGTAWKRSEQTRPFKASVYRAEVRPEEIAPHTIDEITMYSLRHSSIVRQILRGVPIRVIAVSHDTSVAMIERNYSAFLADHSDTIARSGLLEI